MMPIVGTLVSRVDPRKLMAFGFRFHFRGDVLHVQRIQPDHGFPHGVYDAHVQTLGLAFIFVPQNVLAYVGVPREKNNQISSMNSFMRNVGGSIGIALISTSISRIAQQRRYVDGRAHDARAPAYESMVGGLSQTLQGQGCGSVDATQQAYGIVSLHD